MNYGNKIGHSVRVISSMWKREIDTRTENTGIKCLSGVQISILEFINNMYDEGTDIYQKDIESTFKIRRSTVSVILRNMEDHGLVNRISVKEDARLKKIVPTELAREHRMITKGIIDGVAGEATADIPEEDLVKFLEVAEKIMTYLEELGQ